MPKDVIQSVLVFVIGAVAVVTAVATWSLLFSDSAALSTYFVYAGVYLIFGIVVGLFWRGKSIYGAIWLALPLVLLGVVSILFTGFVSKFITDDLPKLATVLLAGTIGCYLGQRFRSHRATPALE